ncbi:unnamed protein product [Rotaria sp. Silwood1]|nr:unnamed protein product [Rotaria sp. Silwood1]CAF1628792.1 unnamed protein product [Rotaria sp. Silwood1]
MHRRRLALVFGNDDYSGTAKLNSCVKDANDMTVALTNLGFQCMKRHNLNKRAMDIAIRDFRAKIRENDCILIYFSGHGMEANGKNYLLPIEPLHDPDFDCINLDTMLKDLNRSGNNLLNIIILDACRADKANDTWKMKATNEEPCLTPAFGKALTSLVRMPNESQFALIFSSDPGTVSFANEIGGNSFFSSALLKHLATPNLELDGMMKQVRKEILQKSSNKQRPWLHSCLTEEFYFNKGL